MGKEGQRSVKIAIKMFQVFRFGIEGSEILIFKAIFLCRKSAESLQKQISLKTTKMRNKLLLMPYLDICDFQCALFSKNVPKF